MNKGTTLIRNIYFYLMSVITLVMTIIAMVDLIDIGLKMTIFPKADYYQTSCDLESFTPKPRLAPGEEATETPAEKEERCAREKQQMAEQRKIDRQRNLVRDIAMLLVATPLFALHFRIAQ